jgi:hypothetical protein
VLGEEPLGVLPHEGMTCDEAVKSRAGAARALNFSSPGVNRAPAKGLPFRVREQAR